jgi:hypothetical protein
MEFVLLALGLHSPNLDKCHILYLLKLYFKLSLIPGRNKRFFSSIWSIEMDWGPSNLQSNGNMRLFLWV